MSKELKKRIAEIPGDDGWWKSSSQERFMRAANDLKKRGLTEDQIVELLEDLYWAAASCFGG